MQQLHLEPLAGIEGVSVVRRGRGVEALLGRGGGGQQEQEGGGEGGVHRGGLEVHVWRAESRGLKIATLVSICCGCYKTEIRNVKQCLVSYE